MHIEHPRATDDFVREPPSAAAIPTGGGHQTIQVDDDGFLDVPDEYAELAMDAFAETYDVEYDDGRVVTDDDAERCDTTLESGETCGRERPCRYHDDTDDEDAD